MGLQKDIIMVESEWNKAHRGKKWVISVLNRKQKRDLINEQVRTQHFPIKVYKYEVNY